MIKFKIYQIPIIVAIITLIVSIGDYLLIGGFPYLEYFGACMWEAGFFLLGFLVCYMMVMQNRIEIKIKEDKAVK